MNENDVSELKALLQKNLEATEETQRMFRSHIKWVRIWTVTKYLLITGLLAYSIVKILPFLEPVVNLFQSYILRAPY